MTRYAKTHARLPPMPVQPPRTPDQQALFAELAAAAHDEAAWRAVVRRMVAQGVISAATAKAMGVKA